ncbi:MAG: SPOR domain-containing protein [Bdellovibrionota bacterium]
MKHLCLIAGSILMIGFVGACSSDHETAPSQSVSSDAEKNALEAEQAEQALEKLAQLQKQNETKSTASSRKPASTGAAKVVRAEKKTEPKAEKKAETKTAKKPSSKAATKKPEGHAPQAAPAKAPHDDHASPQAVAKKEVAGEASVLKAAHAKPTTVAATEPRPASASQIADQLSGHASAKAPTAGRPASHSSVYIVQVGAFRVKENAVKLEEKLKGSGLPVRVKEVNHSKNGMLYVVQFVPTPNRDEADTWRSQVKAKASLDSQLVSRPD